MAGPRHSRNAKGFTKPKNTIKTFKRILEYIGSYRYLLIFVLFFVLLSAVSQVAGTYFLKPLFNDYIVPFIGQKNPDLSGFINTLLLMAAVFALGALSSFLYGRIMLTISTGTLSRIRNDLFRHMQSLPVKYFDTHTHGDLMSRYTHDIDSLREMLSQIITQLISSSITIVSVFIAMLSLSPVLTLLVVVMLVVMLYVVKTLGSKGRMYFQKQQQSLAKVNGYAEEYLEGQRVVKVFTYEQTAKNGFDALNEELYDAAKGANTFANLLRPIMHNLSHIHYALTALVGAVLAVNFGLDIGSLASFLQYTRNFSQPITMISQLFNAFLHALAGAERIFEVLDEEPETDDGCVTLVNAIISEDGSLKEVSETTGIWAWKECREDGSFTYTQLKGDVRFNDVVFGYNPDNPVLKKISLYAKPGQKIAFVGSTGAGKTTVINLLTRFYDVPNGEITFDGINIKKIKKSDLRKSLGMVLQDTHLFSGTVMENIRYGNLDATDEEVIEAAVLANADSFIMHLPKGYDTMLTSDGANLSQGQRQLLSIARAAVANPPVLILDEATSSIDTRTEALIEKGMDRLMRGRTVFVIAHRLSTVRNSNAILVLEHGEIIERGSHDELLAQGGKYYQLYTGMYELS